MKLGFTLRDINIGGKANIGEVNIQMQYNLEEIQGEYALFKKVVKEIPEIVADLGAGAVAFGEMDQAFQEGYKPENNIIDMVKGAISKIKGSATNE